MNAFLALIRKDLRLYFSNKRALLITLAAPIAIAAFFGSLFGSNSGKVSQVPIAVVDMDKSAISKQIVTGLNEDPALRVQELDNETALDLVKKGKLRAAVILLAKFGDQAGRAMFRPGDKPQIAIHFDPTGHARSTCDEGGVTIGVQREQLHHGKYSRRGRREQGYCR